MKKILLSALVVFALSSTVRSQNSDKSFRLGFLLSPQVSWIGTDNKALESSGSYLGYNFGVMLDRFFAKNYAFTTGLTINSTGGAIKYPANAASFEPAFTRKYQLKYVEVPIALKLKSSDVNRLVFNGQFGLSNQVNVKAVDGDGNNIDDQVRLFDIGYHFGGGIEYSLGGNTAVMFGLIFHNGLTDVTDESYGDKARLNRLVFQMGIVF